MNSVLKKVLVPSMLLSSMAAPMAYANDSMCAGLMNLSEHNVGISKAEWMVAGPAAKDPMAAFTGANMSDVDLPAHCLVQGVIEERTGADGKPYGIHFEMRLPSNWQQRLLFQGGGGVDGFLANALGRIPVNESTASPALTRGYAVVSMDGGHPTPSPEFGFDQQARLDFAYAAIGKVTVQAKRIVDAYYSQRPDYTYFMGCSNGGREAMMAAQRYPNEFDGIVAGNPGFHLSRAAITQAWDAQTLMDIAPKDEQGRPVLSKALTQADLNLVSQSVLESCDALDGSIDGVINNYQACHFDPKVLQCDGANAAACLSSAKIDALEKVMAGPVNSRGDKLYSTWPYDSGLSAPGWRAWKLGFSEDASKPDALNLSLGAGSVKYYFLTPPRPELNTLNFDFDEDMADIQQTGAINDAVATYLTSYKAKGGKVIVYQGLSDPVFSADDIASWYKNVSQDTDGGDMAETHDWARLFMVPGMTHCGGGPAFNDFDPLIAIQNWVEKEEAPTSLPAKGESFPNKAQPICPFPQYAKFDGGDVSELESYHCEAPAS